MSAPTPEIQQVPRLATTGIDRLGREIKSVVGTAHVRIRCCTHDPQPARSTYRTAHRARIVLAFHLAAAHNVQIRPDRLRVTPAMVCPACCGWQTIDDIPCPTCDLHGWVPPDEVAS